MDNRRLDTLQAIADGILTRPPPKSRLPEDANLEKVEEWGWSEDELRNGLINGGIEAAMYYGCWNIWSVDNNLFSGELMQYREITDSFDNLPLDDAIDKAVEWASGCQG